MSAAIADIASGGGGDSELANKLFNITGDCNSMFSSRAWDWLINDYGNQITTEGITTISSMFNYSPLQRIPFTLNMKPFGNYWANCDSAFAEMTSLETCPKIRFDLTELYPDVSVSLSYIMSNAVNLTNVDDLFDPEQLRTLFDRASLNCTAAGVLYGCHRLKSLPPWFFVLKPNPDSSYFPGSYEAPYYGLGGYMYCLDEITNIPVWRTNNADTGWYDNAFSENYGAGRIKNFTFETNNGEPYVAPWGSQFIDLSDYYYSTGYLSPDFVDIVREVYGADKEVTSGATYQALKNDPDWFTCDIAYSRYNHDSAVATINSLPDTSAWAEAGGINTIQFCGLAGSATDGGGINTLTEEEIAVAAAKGWTVSLV
jgi:hypothetical protein